jgi:urease accessory protein
MIQGDESAYLGRETFMKRLFKTWLVALPLLALSNAALAHTGIGPTSGFAYGFMHAFLGVDHVLAMTAVGLWAALIGGRAIWLVPASFLGAMLLSGALAMTGAGLPGVELGIAGSVIVLGALIALKVRAPIVVGMGAAALFAIFHGHAHGTEMPADVSGLAYGLGFVLATAFLHGLGICCGLSLHRISSDRLPRVGGGAISAAGIALLLVA